MLREVREVGVLGSNGMRSVGVRGGDGEGAPQENGRAAVMNHHDAPESDAELAFFVGKGVCLGCWIVMESKFDGEAYEAAN